VTDLRQVFDDLVRFETILWGTIDSRLQEECGLSLASLNALLIIDATPLCRVQDIARAVEITVGGASQAVDRLESAGLCARRANPEDRRSSIVELTPEGAELLTRATPVFDRELDRLLRAPLPGTALTQVADGLGALRRSAAAQTSGPATGGPTRHRRQLRHVVKETSPHRG
jgi:MarR family transcriptional regulator, organic hydroperoxide resistance regulator